MSIKKVNLILSLMILSITVLVYAQDSRKKAKEHYQQGDIYYQQGMYKEAEEEFRKALALLEEKQKTAPQAEDYLINIEDEFRIEVWQHPDLSQVSITVRPDGKIPCFLIGDVQAAGRTINEVQQEITEKLKEYIRNPKVLVAIKKGIGRKVLLFGEVSLPKIHFLKDTPTILELIAQAGGFTADSVASSVLLIRGGLDKPQVKRLNLTKALKGDLRQNVVLESGDIVFVPKKFIAHVNYFVSNILAPILSSSGAYKNLRDFNRKE